MPIGRRAAIRTCLLAVGLGGCTGFGPDTMRYQQADYAAALADAGKRQTLLNIVKLRYGDVPAFVTVNQILAGYSLQGTFSVGTELLTGGSLRLSDDANVGVGGTFTNSPTITYAPVTGADFARTFLAPMQPADLFGLMLAGVPPELVLGLGLHSIGGYDNERASPAAQVAADPSSPTVLALLLELQRAGPAADPVGGSGPGARRHAQARAGRGRRTRPSVGCAQLLELPDDRDTFELVYTLGDGQAGPDRDPYPLADRGAGPARRRHRRARTATSRTAAPIRPSRTRPRRTVSADRGAAWLARAARRLRGGRLRRRLVLDRQSRPRHQARVQLRHAAPVPEREQQARPAAGDHDPRRADGSHQRQHDMRTVAGARLRAASR